MRVLMFGWEFPPFNSGGLGTACLGLTKALSRSGHDIVFVLPKQLDLKVDYMDLLFADVPRLRVKAVNSPLAGYLTDHRYRVLMGALPPELARLYGRDLYEETQRYAEKASAIASTVEHDVIHAHDWLSFPAGMAAKAASGKPLVAHVHATEFDRTADGGVNQLVYECERAGMHAADAVVAVSNYTKERVARHYEVAPEKIHVVHNGVDPREVRKLGASKLNDHYKIVLFLGRITVQKGPDWFLKAARLVLERDKDVLFVVAGAGDMERQVILDAADSGIADRVVFTGFRRGDDIDRLYQMADLYVMPSVSEPFGITALEAVQNGTPVIVSKQSGVREVLPEAVQVDFWDTRRMADEMLRLLSHREEAKRLGQLQRAALPGITWDAAALKLASLYKNVLPVRA
ncbi:MAG TPA: glycosyltransferase family 4 protein [Candidatus Binatia bacterium]|jgi:glycosyltransferase involved in cell wall biosynthesis|nr:glycosyltransferase family 4 protein [Candidatus Binatia bacterium]